MKHNLCNIRHAIIILAGWLSSTTNSHDLPPCAIFGTTYANSVYVANAPLEMVNILYKHIATDMNNAEGCHTVSQVLLAIKDKLSPTLSDYSILLANDDNVPELKRGLNNLKHDVTVGIANFTLLYTILFYRWISTEYTFVMFDQNWSL